MALNTKPKEWVGRKFKNTETGITCVVDDFLRFKVFFTNEKGEKLTQHYMKFALVHDPA